MLLLLWFLLSSVPQVAAVGSLLCPDTGTTQLQEDHVLDCIGLRFSWLHSVFQDLPAVLNFALKLRCATGLCPRELEDYGCMCRFQPAGGAVDTLDSCCAAHRRCHREAGATCSPALQPLPQNWTCSELEGCNGDECQRRFCECDRVALHCLTHSFYNSSLRGLDPTTCSNQTDLDQSLNSSDLWVQDVEDIINTTAGVTDIWTENGYTTELMPVNHTGQIIQTTDSTTARDLVADQGSWTGHETTMSPALTETPASLEAEEEASVTVTTARSTVRSTRPNSAKESRTTAATAESGEETEEQSEEDGPEGEDAAEKRAVPFFAWSMLESVGLTDIQPPPGRRECPQMFTIYGGNGQARREMPALGAMLHCLTDRCPHEYEMYGCHCGRVGTGAPLDQLDRCCFFHACCLQQIVSLGCRADRKLNAHVSCHQRKPRCMGVSVCDKLQCVCDRTTAECMAAASFNHSLATQRCRGPAPPCRHTGRPLAPPASPLSSEEGGASAVLEIDTLAPPTGRLER
ncbi:otoconin-90 [Synchiropus picturatus]